MTDKELLELAAKAAGIDPGDSGPITYYAPDGIWIANGNNNTEKFWNPLTDDGDALRLAVKLNLLLMPYPLDNAIRVTRLDQPDTIVSFGTPPDPCAATRRAITRAAAEIGKALEE